MWISALQHRIPVNDRVTQVTAPNNATTLNGVTTTITSARSYSADGALNTQAWGNGKVETRSF